jgi:hypothetical protein
MDVIRTWLNGRRDYESGIKLYNLYGEDTLLKRLFAEKGQTAFKEKKLQDSLRNLLKSTAQKKDQATSAIAIKVDTLQKHVVLNTGWGDQLDEVETALYEKFKPLYTELSDLNSRLEAVAMAGQHNSQKEMECGQIALRILDLDDQCDDVIAELNYYREHKTLPEKKMYGDLCVDTSLIPTKLKNHERYAREYRGKLAKDPSDLNAAAQLKKHEWYVEQYKGMLKINAV